MFRVAFLLLVLAGPASAQSSPTADAAATALATAPARLTAADTVQAIHRLYARHRRLGTILTFGTIAADMALAEISANKEAGRSSSGGGAYGWNPGGLQFGFGGFAIIYGIAASPVLAVGIQQLIAYRPRHEAGVLAAYEQHHRLPARVRRRLAKELARP